MTSEKEEGDGMIVFQEYLSAGELFWPRVCNLRWFLFRRSYLFFRLSLSHIASLLYNYDKNKPREATRVTENGKYPLKVQASARCWPLTNVVESSVKDWMVVRECGKRREKWQRMSECETELNARHLQWWGFLCGGSTFRLVARRN